MTHREPLTTRVLVLGGARSGKSAWAEDRLRISPAVDYLATGGTRPDDPEWVERVRLHQERRPSSWRTIESIDLASELVRDTDRALLIDCLTVWLSRVLDDVGAWTDEPGWYEAMQQRTQAVVAAFKEATRPVIAVSNEVGQGIVPLDPGSRMFRDEMGRLNVAVAAAVNEVWFCTAGIANRLK